MSLLVALRPVVGPGPHIAAVGRPKVLALRCTATAQSRDPEREALSRRTLLGAGLALGEFSSCLSAREMLNASSDQCFCTLAAAAARNPHADPRAAAGLAALSRPRRASAAEGDAASAGTAGSPSDNNAGAQGGTQAGPGPGAPGAEGADASGVPLTQEELERQAAAKLLEVSAHRLVQVQPVAGSTGCQPGWPCQLPVGAPSLHTSHLPWPFPLLTACLCPAPAWLPAARAGGGGAAQGAAAQEGAHPGAGGDPGGAGREGGWLGAWGAGWAGRQHAQGPPCAWVGRRPPSRGSSAGAASLGMAQAGQVQTGHMARGRQSARRRVQHCSPMAARALSAPGSVATRRRPCVTPTCHLPSLRRRAVLRAPRQHPRPPNPQHTHTHTPAIGAGAAGKGEGAAGEGADGDGAAGGGEP